MSNPIEILGVYKFPFKETQFQKLVDDGEIYEDEVESLKEQYQSVWVIEVLVPTGMGINIGAITQEILGRHRSSWQAPYDEQEVGGNPNHYVFFFHFLDPSKPLLTEFGPLDLPSERLLPEYLSDLKYELLP